uniref:PUM-HD domain-containing protein n=1 Tax=Loa loa TaxID=7209 RepID=A0A1I7V920_LOALO
MQQTTTIPSLQYDFQPSPDIYSQYGMERMGTDAATDQLCQSISSITVNDKENGMNETHWCSPCSQYTDSSGYTYLNPAEHQLMACDSCVQQCEVSRINSLRNGECWDSYECYGVNNNIELMQPTLFYLLTSGCIANFGKDEKGSRFVQEEFTKSSPVIRQMMFDYLFERGGFDWFSNDPHGNFIIQKIAMEAFPGIEQARVVEHVANKVVKMCSNRYGSRIMQRVFERFDFGYRVELLNKLSGSECFLAVDSCATHVMQLYCDSAYTFEREFQASCSKQIWMPRYPIRFRGKILHFVALLGETSSTDLYAIKNLEFCQNDLNLIKVIGNVVGGTVIHSNCNIVMKYAFTPQELEISACTTRYANTPNEFKTARRLLNKLLRRLTENCTEFTDHQFANYVMQHVITSEFHPDARDYIIKHAILSNVLTLSQEKFASHVVEKSLQHASPKVLHCLMGEIFDGYVKDDKGRDALDIMLFDQYGNYVVQTMINVSIDVYEDRREGDLLWLARLSERISRHEPRLMRYSSGKKIIEKMKQVL